MNFREKEFTELPDMRLYNIRKFPFDPNLEINFLKEQRAKLMLRNIKLEKLNKELSQRLEKEIKEKCEKLQQECSQLLIDNK